MRKINLDSTIKKIHFIGIGGISMSGLAEILIEKGYLISGSDLKSSNLTEQLQKKGITFYIGHSEENIKSPDLVIYTAAVKESNPELKQAKLLNIPCIERAELLGILMKQYSKNISVSGTHGKTTTTSMISMIMLKSNKNPTIHIGGELNEINGNTFIGGNDYFITEACEYVESFLHFNPYLALILNIESDHLDYFKDIDHIKKAFLKFLNLVPANGLAVLCKDDQNINSIIPYIENCKNIITYSVNDVADFTAKNISFDEYGYASYVCFKGDNELGLIKLSVPGIHNVSNSLGAIASTMSIGCDFESVQNGLLAFKGTKRRFEIKGKINDILVVDDYAHHPTEIQATLKASKNLKCNKIWCIFQPHTYTRTKALLNEFIDSFPNADNVIIANIYAAREADPGDISSKAIVDKCPNSIYLNNFNDIVDYLCKNVSSGDLVITMGAGDIYKVGEMYLHELEKSLWFQ